MEELRRAVPGEAFDSKILLYCLRDYKKPRDKISELLQKEAIIQLKKGLYVFGEKYRKELVVLEEVAAMLIQPSYISREYALFQYGVLPERVVTITCMTTKKKRSYATPFGEFTFNSLSSKKFAIGVFLQNGGGYLYATKEKALCDWLASFQKIKSVEELEFLLIEESRIDHSVFLSLDRELIVEISKVYHNRNVKLFTNYVQSFSRAT